MRYLRQTGAEALAVMDTMEVRFYGTELLKGADPAALPVEQPTTFMMAINLRTAKQLGITIPSSILFRATEVSC